MTILQYFNTVKGNVKYTLNWYSEFWDLLNHFVTTHRAGGIGPAAPVLAGPVFSQGKSKIPFLQKASNKQSASVILDLLGLLY